MSNFKHGHGSVRRGHSPAYDSWANMKQRCLNPNNKDYKYYGGRGIEIDPDWLNFEEFLRDMGERPLGFTLDRIDNNWHYEPGNCRWITQAEQNKNRRPFESKEV